MISWVSLFVGLVLGFVIGSLACRESGFRGRWNNLLYKWMESLEMGDFLHISFSVGKESDDDEDEDDASTPYSPIPQHRLN